MDNIKELTELLEKVSLLVYEFEESADDLIGVSIIYKNIEYVWNGESFDEIN
jgi:hypothetical protein